MDKLIRKLEGAKRGNQQYPENVGYNEALDVAIEIIREHSEWIEVSKELPDINNSDSFDKEHRVSVRVICKEINDPEFRFGVYHHKSQTWSLEGRRGDINVISWCYIPPIKNAL